MLKTSAFFRLIATLSFSMLFLPACSKAALTPLELTAYNHTDQGIAWYSVSIPNGIGGDAGYLGAGAGGGGRTCCVAVPSIWHPGLSVTVTSVTVVDNVEKTAVRSVAVPKYDSNTAAVLNVHFLRSGAVKVLVTRLMLGHRDYPLNGKEAELKPGVPIKILWP